MQQNNKTRQKKRGSEVNIKRYQKSAKKGALSEYCQIYNTNTKKIHNLEMNTTACKYLNNSRHRNLLLGK